MKNRLFRLIGALLVLMILLGCSFAVLEARPAAADKMDPWEEPFVGMNESDISWTTLGRPDKVEFQKSRWRTRKDATVYTWLWKEKAVFTARVEEGVVVYVADHRNLVRKLLNTQSSRPAVYEKETVKEEDPYEAYNYANAEDFYDEYRDDFFDYEEAEDYWDEYGEDW